MSTASPYRQAPPRDGVVYETDEERWNDLVEELNEVEVMIATYSHEKGVTRPKPGTRMASIEPTLYSHWSKRDLIYYRSTLQTELNTLRLKRIEDKLDKLLEQTRPPRESDLDF